MTLASSTIAKGNAHEVDTRGTGWFVGFSDWTRAEPTGLLHVPRDLALAGLCLKWFDHPSGQQSEVKPVSEGRTISILVSEGAAFELEFCDLASFEPERTEVVLLVRHGDFAAWGAGLYHRWRCLERASILTVRWQPAPGESGP